jgi:hypothetical protein
MGHLYSGKCKASLLHCFFPNHNALQFGANLPAEGNKQQNKSNQIKEKKKNTDKKGEPQVRKYVEIRKRNVDKKETRQEK